MSSLTPEVIHRETLLGGTVELVEWNWPELFQFSSTQDTLMLEMSLPPYSADASVCYPDFGRGQYCFMGTLFVRYPGILLQGRSEAGHIRVLRFTFDKAVAKRVMNCAPEPTLDFLQSLLNIRNDTLRTLMRLAHRELADQAERSVEALQAIMELVVIELERLFDHQHFMRSGGRLAPWQYRRIRERLDAPLPPPSVAELSELCGISARHLHRQFFALTGKTVSGYIDARRIEQAKAMLADRDTSIKAIAQECGFTHSASFSRAFRRATGLTPQGFRQRVGPKHHSHIERKGSMHG